MIGEAVVTINLKADSILGKSSEKMPITVTVPVYTMAVVRSPGRNLSRKKKKPRVPQNKKGGN